MAVIKLFPCKDATLFTETPLNNSGLSEILDLTKTNSIVNSNFSAIGRALVKFDETDISSSVANYIGSAPFSAYYGMYLAYASAIPTDYYLELYAVSESWDMGTGRIDDIPNPEDGVSWQWINADMTGWNTGSVGSGIGFSYFTGSGGGGNWYTSSYVTESFHNRSEKDVYINVSSIVNQYVSGTLVNQGFIIKNGSNIEFDPNYAYALRFFSVDTNTIYPPFLDLKWDDSKYNPNTSSMNLIQSSNIAVSLQNNKGRFDQLTVQRFNVNVREQYPPRTFVTTSLYTVGEYLPSSSYWRLKDYDTNNIIFDFDTNYTKISVDQTGNYFMMYMNGLEPERYYKLEIRVDYSGSTMIFSDDYYFKVNKE